MSEDLRSFFLIFIAAVSLLVAIRSNSRVSKQDFKNSEDKAKKDAKDAEDRVKENAVIETKTSTSIEIKLDYISRGMDDIKLNNRAQTEKIDCITSNVSEMKSKMCGMDESLKSAHKRIDSLQNK